MTENKYAPPKFPNPFYKYIWNRTHQYKKNFLMFITGPSGEGKSYCALRMAELLDPRFSIDKVCFTPSQFFRAIKKVKVSGEVIILDEMGVAMSARKWASMSNILMNEVLQTFRYKHIIALFVVPDFSFVDSQARKMAHATGKVVRKAKEPAKLWIYRVSVNDDGKIYRIHPRHKFQEKTKDETINAVKSITFNELASKELLEAYEKKHRDFKEKLRAKNEKLLRLMEQELIGDEKDLNYYIKEVVQDREKYTNVKGNLDYQLIAAQLNLQERKALQVKKLVEKQAHTRASL